MKLPYPNKDATDWFDQMATFFRAVDSHTYAHREDRNTVMYSTATWSWDAGTGLLSWDDAFWVTGAQTGGRWKVAAGSLTIQDGYMMVVAIPRYPQQEDVVTDVQARAACEQTDEGFVVCVRKGANLYFRTGVMVSSGSSVNIFNVFGGGAPAGNVQEHQQHMHDNGIVRSSTSGTALDVSVTDGGGAADDTLDVAAIPGGDYAYVNGKQRTEPSAPFSYTNPTPAANEVRLYRSILSDIGDPLIQQRASYTQPAALDPFQLVNCSRGIGAGARNVVFTTVVAGSSWEVRFDGGPRLLVTSTATPDGPVRLWSQDGVGWIDLYFEAGFDWTKVDIGGPHTVIVTFAPEIDEGDVLALGTAVVRLVGGWVTWGYGTTKEVVDERQWGNLGLHGVKDDLLASIAERAAVNGLTGVVFDRKAGWSGRTSGTPAPLAEWPERNFGLTYSSPNMTVQGGKLFVAGEVLEVQSATLVLSLTIPGQDYYLWWDRSDGTLKITAESAFPAMSDGTQNPLAWILGGTDELQDYVQTWIDKPTRGVPLYVFQRGGADTQIAEDTLCDLRRNVTKAALKDHVSVGFRADWMTASFQAFSNVPDINQTEAEFGCLDAAFRYINAVPHELGGGDYPGSGRLEGRVVSVCGYTEERRTLVVPAGTIVQGSGFATIGFGPNAKAVTFSPTGGSPRDKEAMLWVGATSSLRNLYVVCDTATTTRAAVALDGQGNGASISGETRLEGCFIYSSGAIGVIGQRIGGGAGPYRPHVHITRCTIIATDEHSLGVPAYGLYGVYDLDGVLIKDSTIYGDDVGMDVGNELTTSEISQSLVSAYKIFGGTGVSWPTGTGIRAPLVTNFTMRDSWVRTQHRQAVSLGGGGKPDENVLLKGCVFVGDNLSGSGANKGTFISSRAEPEVIRDCWIQGPTLDITESQFNLVGMGGAGETKFIDNVCYAPGDAFAWDNGLYINASDGEAIVKGNIIEGPAYNPANGGLGVGIDIDGKLVVRVDHNTVYYWAGIGIDVGTAFGYDVVVEKNHVDGGGAGNGIRAIGEILGNVVQNLRSWGIDTFSNSHAKDNFVWNVEHSAQRIEGTFFFNEYGAWGIRYYVRGIETEISDLDVSENQIRNVRCKVEEAASPWPDLCCGIGPQKDFSDSKALSMRCRFDQNDIYVVDSDKTVMTNIECYGICLSHPSKSISCDGNIIEYVGGGTTYVPACYGIGVLQGPNFFLVEMTSFSFCNNEIMAVTAIDTAIGIYAGSGSKVTINENDITEVLVDTILGTMGAYIAYQDNSGGMLLPFPNDGIHVCDNEIGTGSEYAFAGLVMYGIYINQTDVEINNIEVVGNEFSSIANMAAGTVISITSDGSNRLVKDNQMMTVAPNLPAYGIRVAGFLANGGAPVNVEVSENQADGEFTDVFIWVYQSAVVTVAENQQAGFSDDVAYGDGILVQECQRIDVHDNNLLNVTPAQNLALIRIRDCLSGSVHDNILRGRLPAAARIDSLRFEDTGAGPLPTCDDLHIHDNKIFPINGGVAGPPYEIGFYPGANPAAFGTDMTIWANVFGAGGVAGTENFTGSAWYVAAPAANNWDGTIFK